ncbi:3-phosphoinositide-dependent protein kinase 1-like [Rhopilema esculentum]|uniref:3-phosphoinositide-dependent protein kinase 1-like n=1 Tax=Rhopilema esculentum TaxID=499914 RepID=UPI0031D885D3
MKNSDSVAPPSEEVPSKDAKEEDKSAKKDNKQVSKPKKKSKDDFKFIKILGEGSYSTVYLVEEIASSKQFAMKVLEKRHIIKEKKVPYVSREKEALAMTNHPFIVKLYFTFQDIENLYYGLSFAKKGEMLPYINKLGSFNEECTQFYSAEIIVALEYLHSLGIIHRDLKPENVLFGENMHILITDFGTSKLLKKDKTKASSFVGTAEYVSPELLTDKIAYKSSDLWALGCIIYQLRSGRTPFRASNEYQTFQRIIKLEYEFPEGFPECPKELVQKLLVLDPAKRIGCEELGGFPELKAHPFFKGIEWDTLPEQQPPKLLPYLPSKSADCEDLGSNYDISVSSDEDEELMNDMFNDLLIKNITNDVREKSSSVSSSQASSTSSSSKDSPWQQFVGNRPILKEGLVDKRKGLFAKRRQLILTEGPHLFYVDPHAMVLKGEIPWTKDLRPEAKSFKIFFVHTPSRTYYLEDPEGYAIEWVKKINEVHERYFK